jgi:carboxy-terminal domain RNA polymerase II polypeptide A small phosphatase
MEDSDIYLAQKTSPSILGSMDTKKLLVLDLDETLIFTEYGNKRTVKSEPDFLVHDQGYNFAVWKRPDLAWFLVWCFEHFEVAIWSAADQSYVEKMLAQILPSNLNPCFIWTSERCTIKRMHQYGHDGEVIIIKDIKKILRSKKRFKRNDILVVDDNDDTYSRNYGNALPIEPFQGDKDDRELVRISFVLSKLKNHNNIRKIEKRQWETKYLRGTE